MRIALFGATGGTGRQVLAQALDWGHTLTALARDPRDGLTTIGGDVLDPKAVAQCVQGAEAAICVLGSYGRQEPIEARGTERILAAMHEAGVRRLVVVTPLGVGDSRARIA